MLTSVTHHGSDCCEPFVSDISFPHPAKMKIIVMKDMFLHWKAAVLPKQPSLPISASSTALYQSQPRCCIALTYFFYHLYAAQLISQDCVCFLIVATLRADIFTGIEPSISNPSNKYIVLMKSQMGPYNIHTQGNKIKLQLPMQFW